MSLRGSPLSDKSTSRIAGLAEIDRDCTALRRPPLLHFSGCQPISMTTGRRTSSAVSSQMNAADGSRLPSGPGFQGAFIYLTPSAAAGGQAADFRQAGLAGRFLRERGVEGLGRAR